MNTNEQSGLDISSNITSLQEYVVAQYNEFDLKKLKSLLQQYMRLHCANEMHSRIILNSKHEGFEDKMKGVNDFYSFISSFLKPNAT